MMRISSWMVAAVLLASATARAAVPSEFSVQGVLRDNAGKLQTMPVNVTVTLYNMVTAGTKLAGPYVVNNVPVSNGLFTLTIPDPSLRAQLSPAAEIWVELSAGNDTFPRQRVSTEIYALMCSAAETFTGALAGDVTGTQGATKVKTPAGAKRVVGGNIDLFTKGTDVTVGSITITPPGPGVIQVTAQSGAFGFFDHVTGTKSEMSCCLGTSPTSCQIRAYNNLHRNVPSLAGGAEGTLTPFHMSDLFVYSGTPATFTAYFFCQWTAGAGNGAFVKETTLQAVYLPTAL
jgi:hypothetical protein